MTRTAYYIGKIMYTSPIGFAGIMAIPMIVLIMTGFIVFDKEEWEKTKNDFNVVQKGIATGTLFSFDGGVLQNGTGANESVFKSNLEQIYTNPENIKIDSIGLNAEVSEIGVDEFGTMETPSDWNGTGWYYKSAKPGEKGNMIINGHYDNNWGGAAAFWQLKNVKVGDKVVVVDKYGKVYTYEAKESFLIDIKDPNRLDVLDHESGKSIMTLITCGGVWVPGKSTYDKRLVLKAELVQN